MTKVNMACDCDETYSFSEDVAGRAWAHCRACGHQWVTVDTRRPHGYERPNTGNHPDHPPVPGGHRGGDFELARPWSDAQQVINPGLATEAVDVTHGSALWFPRAGLEADCMIVDPPYSAKVHDSATSCGVGGLNEGRTQGVRKRDLGFASLTPALRRVIATYATQVRRWSAIYSDIESVSGWIAALEAAGAEYVRTVPWVRWSQPQLSGDRPPSGCEMVILAHRAERTARGKIVPVKKRWNGPGSLTHLAAASLRGTGKHPTEKPLDDILRLVSWLSDPGETVLDPCCGAGTTVLAAALLGRGAIGLERDAAWAEYADGEGGRLFDAMCEAGAGLSERDAERVDRFVEAQRAEASAVPAPKAANGSDVKTWERAQRRLADAKRAEAWRTW